jgi:hypothetical protein
MLACLTWLPMPEAGTEKAAAVHAVQVEAAAKAAQQTVQAEAEKAAAVTAAAAAAARAEKEEAVAAARAERGAVRGIADEWAAADGPAHAPTSFARSHFKPQYEWVQLVRPLQPQQKDRVLFCVRRIVEGFCEGLFPGDDAAAC